MGGPSGMLQDQSKWPEELAGENKILLVFGPTVTVGYSSKVDCSSGKDYLAVKEGTNEDESFVGLPLKYLNWFKNENDRQTALSHETYNLIKAKINNLDKSQGIVAVIGGINIKIEGSSNLFMPLMFQVGKENRMEVFGDSNLLSGCIQFRYLKD